MNFTRFAVLLASFAGLALAAHAQVTTIVNDTFSSAMDRQSGTISTDRANWYVLSNNTAAQTATVVSGGSNGTPLSIGTGAIAGSSNAYMARWNPVTLSVGETLTVNLTVSFPRLSASSDLRFGVFDSTFITGTPENNGTITGDQTSNNRTQFIGDNGYVMNANHSTRIGTAPSAGDLFRIGERTNLANGNVFSSGADFTAGQDQNGTNQPWDTTSHYTFTMSFYYAATDAMHVNAMISGGNFGSGVSAIEWIDGTPSATTFDYLLFRMATAPAQDITFHALNVEVSTAPIPEPSTYAALLGLGALGFVMWRRRRVVAA